MTYVFVPFGYRPEFGKSVDVAALKVAEGKTESTLEPLVIVYMRFYMNPEDEGAYSIKLDRATDVTGLSDDQAVTEQLAMSLPLEQAEYLKNELERWIKRAKEKHFK